MWRRPLLSVVGPSGQDVLPKLDGLWRSVSVTDKAGKESDSAKIVCVGPPALVSPPNRGDIFLISMGWADEGLVLQGRYSFQKLSLNGGPARGETMTLQFRAADYVDKLKASGREHYDDKSYGDIISDIAKKAGLQAQVDPDLAKIKIGYRIRWDQSLIDFAAELSEEVGATVKPAGGKLVAMKRGGGASGSGRALDPIEIGRDQCIEYSIEIDPRPETGKTAAAWHDEKSGRRKLVKKSADREGPTKILPHPYRSEDEAGRAADADIYESDNASGSGSFDLPGLPKARAEAPVTVSGFGPMIDGSWKAESVEKTVTAKDGFLTTVSVKAGRDKKGGKAKGGKAAKGST